jgi:hypothetical protein
MNRRSHSLSLPYSMNKPRPNPLRIPSSLWVTLGILLMVVGVQGQTKRCDLVGRDSTIVGNQTHFKRCLDLANLSGKTVVVPSNVTRIDNDGLSLCKGSLRLGGDADIVFVLDQSGSMGATHAWINTSVSPPDTSFYFNTDGCTNTTLLADVSYKIFEGIAETTPTPKTVTIKQLQSNAGCRSFSGDPYKIRATAFRQAIDAMVAGGATQSTAGYIGFYSTLRNPLAPRLLNSTANINAVKQFMNIEELGGTNYSAPLRLAKTWLNDTVITNTSKQAIVFISDGAPSPADSNGVALLADGKMPPIYSIYLSGRATPDTAKLLQLSTGSGGKFFRVPPLEPDSVVKIVKQILNLILKEFQPNTALVSNNSLAPVQTATSAMPTGFTLQVDGSWLMKLSDIIGLKPLTTNAISVRTNFLETGGAGVDTQTINFTIQTTDPASSSSNNLPGKPFAVTCYDKSSLVILNQANARPPFFTDADLFYKIKVRTAPVPLDSILAPSRTPIKGDAETQIVKLPTISTDSIVFSGSYPFLVQTAARTNGNGTLESNLYDSIIVSWVHPRDAQDKVSDTMTVRAAKKQAVAYFASSNGGPLTTSYLADATTVFVVIKDQVADPRRTYTAVISSERFGIDRETVTLTELPGGSGTFVAQLSISNLAKNSGDNLLQVSVGGDQLRVVYKDQIDLDSAVGTAGFDENVQEAPDLQFTDATGTPLPADAIWSPANGKLFVSYSDDYAYGRVATKSVQLSLASKKYGSTLGTDRERITLNLDPAASGSRATWTGSINLADVFPATDSNATAETRYRGEASIAVNSHDNVGVIQTTSISDFLVIAYPDSQAAIQWKMADTSTVLKGTEGLIVTVQDQNFTTGTNDSVFVTVTCLKSGDSVSNISAKEVSPLTYLTGTLIKDESVPNAGDRILSCLTTDQIRITYVDPVYNILTELLINEVAKPEANPAGRKFITSENVTLTSTTPGSVIYYTLDGSTPVPGKSDIYSDPIRISVSTTIKAIATKPGWKDSKILTQIYTKEAVASRLEILDENGNQISGSIITGAAKTLRIKLITTQDNLAAVITNTRTLNQNDLETVALNNFGFLGTSFEYWESVPVNHPSAKANSNDTINVIGTDTLIVRWVNPLNAADIAADTIIIKPAFVAAEVYFSLTEGGPRITQYPTNQDTLFIVVKTRPKDPSLNYTVEVTSSELGIDKETLTLKELSTPGTFSAKVPVGTLAKVQGDKIIQVAAAGDQLKAVFIDPVYKDSYQGDAGFAQQVQESASLEFIDATGNLVAPTDVWSPDKGKVFLRYMDDWNAGINAAVLTQSVRLLLTNKKSGEVVGTDSETVILTLKGVPTGTRATWEGSISLEDNAKATRLNGTLETYYRGELSASLTPHNNAGVATPPDIQDQLLIAYPNQSAEIVIQNMTGGGVTRETDKVNILIREQIFTKSGDGTIDAVVSCIQSGDKVAKVVLVFDGTKYVIKPPLDKGEINSGALDKGDALLLCRDSDVLNVVYTDPVFLDVRTADVRWTDETKGRLYYASSKDSTERTSFSDATDKDFLIIVEGRSPNREKIDTIKVTLITAQGERETVEAIETGILTGKFIVKVPFAFSSSDPNKENKKVEGKITIANRVNQVLVNGEVDIGGEKIKGDLSLFSNYDLITRAYIKDLDEDGHADHVYLVFDHKLVTLPSALDSVYWNTVASGFSRKASGGQLSFLSGSDSTIVVADFTASQFGLNLTNIPDGQSPYALLPDDNIFAGQKAKLADSVGVVAVSANKLPSNLQSYNFSGTEKRFNPDTLVISISEKIKTTMASYNAVMRFSKGCSEYKESIPLKTFSEPSVSSDGLTWTVIVDNTPDSQTPLVGDCIFLEVDGRYVDLQGNLPGRLGVPISGENPKLVIRGFRGFPPVAGMDPETPGFVLVTNDKRADQNGTFSNQAPNGNWQVLWIPPYGFDERDPVNSLQNIANHFTDPQEQDRHPEIATPKGMPRDISAIQVITSGSYKAQIHIYDNLGHFVRSMDQSYGMNGEDKNPWRATDKGQLSFLVWDLKDKDGQMAGQGVYVWKVSFLFIDKNVKSEVRYTRTGVMRN